jgi:hypothetical protein
MRVHSFTGYAALAALVGALACGGNPETDEVRPETDEAAAARDTTELSDTLAQARDTTMPGDTVGQVQTPGERTPTDTFLDQQGVGTPSDTAGYGGLEQVDTTAQAGQQDTTGFGQDTTGFGQDTSGMTGDTTQTGQPGDTTGYDPSQQPSQDTTSYR